ncbi:hypothetical protein Vi05172_g8618 [Venturia inaequalis]|nr:hypothetical protein Vi05172_g8618 [Venturia inaequalis]
MLPPLNTRLRRAIVSNHLSLVKRIVHNNPTLLQNPDYDDKSNTSLHLAAKHGHYGIAEYLIDAGHEDQGISRNSDWDTPLMLASEAKQVDVGEMLITQFPRCASWTNRKGMDALMTSARSGALHLVELLLRSHPPADATAHDDDGNTALHHASAAGELKALRLLLHFGASPLAQNNYSWTPIAYSATSAAEAYFKQLVAEFERRRVEDLNQQREREREKGRQRVGGVRLVTQDDAGSPIGGAQVRTRDDLSALPAPGIEWSPIERRAVTPTEGRNHTGWSFGARGRASSGD